MTLQSLAGESLSPLNLGAAPYLPPVTSDVVIDLSHWQAPVDFSRAKEAGIIAVILKATQGAQWIDATFAQRFAAATAAGLLVGAYHFLDDSPPKQQAEHFLSVAEDCPVLALDAEPNEIGGTVTVAQAAEAAARLQMATGRAPWSMSAATGPTSAARVFPTASCRDVRYGFRRIAGDQFVRRVGRSGRCGNTPTGRLAPMCCRCPGSANATAAASQAALQNSSHGGKRLRARTAIGSRRYREDGKIRRRRFVFAVSFSSIARYRLVIA